jgi:hypothetical protein
MKRDERGVHICASLLSPLYAPPPGLHLISLPFSSYHYYYSNHNISMIYKRSDRKFGMLERQSKEMFEC